MNPTALAIPLIMGMAMAAVISFTLSPLLIRMAQRRQWMDVPDNDRKTHGRKVAQLGGVALIMACLLTTPVVIGPAAFPPWWAFNLGGIMFFLIGLLDDRLHLRPGLKMIAQLFPVALAVWMGGLSLPHWTGWTESIETWPWISLTGAMIFLLYYVNAFNFIDGMDGLATGLGLVQALLLGTGFLILGAPGAAFISFTLAGSLLGFLPFNRHPARLFLGDNGSLFLGFSLGALSLWFIRLTGILPVPEYTDQDTLILLALANLSLPMVDALRVFGIRIYKGISPFKGDRNHIHHRLMDLGLSPGKITLLLVFQNLVLLGLCWMLKDRPWYLTLSLLLLIYLIAYYRLNRWSKSRKDHNRESR